MARNLHKQKMKTEFIKEFQVMLPISKAWQQINLFGRGGGIL